MQNLRNNRRKTRRRSNSLGGRRAEDSIFKKDDSDRYIFIAGLLAFAVLFATYLAVDRL